MAAEYRVSAQEITPEERSVQGVRGTADFGRVCGVFQRGAVSGSVNRSATRLARRACPGTTLCGRTAKPIPECHRRLLLAGAILLQRTDKSRPPWSADAALSLFIS